MKKIIMMSALVLTGICANAQLKMGTNPTVINSSSALEIESSDKGFLMPRVSLLSSTDLTTVPNPVKGLQVFNIKQSAEVDSNYVYWYDGTKWIRPLTSVTVGNAPGTPINWSLPFTTPVTINSGQIYVAGPFTVPVTGWYTFKNGMNFSSNGDGSTVFNGISKDDATPSQFNGIIWDTRFVLGPNPSGFVGPAPPGFLYLLKTSNYYIKYAGYGFNSGVVYAVSLGFILTQFK